MRRTELRDVAPTGSHVSYWTGREEPTYSVSELGSVASSLRRAAGLSIHEVADWLGITPMDLNDLERGAKATTAGGWVRLIGDLRASLDSVLAAAATGPITSATPPARDEGGDHA